jgi:hypothetical protein
MYHSQASPRRQTVNNRHIIASDTLNTLIFSRKPKIKVSGSWVLSLPLKLSSVEKLKFGIASL